jgi:hypothetical protein
MIAAVADVHAAHAAVPRLAALAAVSAKAIRQDVSPALEHPARTKVMSTKGTMTMMA